MASATSERVLIPQPAAPALRFSTIASGDTHTCGITVSGEVYCWGGNYYGELGTLAYDPGRCHHPCTATPTRVAGAPALVAITGGGWHTCGLTATGDVFCWGDNLYGQLGDTVGTGCLYSQGLQLGYPCSAQPVAVSGGRRYVTLTAGGEHTCGLTAEGEAYCWGKNNAGQFGNGTAIGSTSPVPAGNGLRFRTLRARGDATCGLATDLRVYCWGDDFDNQLGNGPLRYDSRLVPALVLLQR